MNDGLFYTLIQHPAFTLFARDAVTSLFLPVINKLWLVYLFLVVMPSLPVVIKTGILPVIAMVLFTVIVLLIGHLMRGPDLTYPSAIAVDRVARNLGLARFIAILNQDSFNVLPTIVGYAVSESVVTIFYSSWVRQRMTQQSSSVLVEGSTMPS